MARPKPLEFRKAQLHILSGSEINHMIIADLGARGWRRRGLFFSFWRGCEGEGGDGDEAGRKEPGVLSSFIQMAPQRSAAAVDLPT